MCSASIGFDRLDGQYAFRAVMGGFADGKCFALLSSTGKNLVHDPESVYLKATLRQQLSIWPHLN